MNGLNLNNTGNCCGNNTNMLNNSCYNMRSEESNENNNSCQN